MNSSNNQQNEALAALSPNKRSEVADAYNKLLRKEKLSRRERAVLDQFEKDREDRLRWQYYRSIPKKHWREMSGRQVKVLNEQAERYDLPLDGRVINLPKLARAFHDFLAKNAQRLAQEDDALLRSAQSSPALERYREERARLAELDRLERERSVLPVHEMRQAMGVMAHFLRQAGDQLTSRFGNDAGQILIDAIKNFERVVEEAFGGPASDSGASSKSEDVDRSVD